MPSPAKATLWPRVLSSEMRRDFSAGRRPACMCRDAKLARNCFRRFAPVSRRHDDVEAKRLKSRTASRAVGFNVSATARIPDALPSMATKSGLWPRSAERRPGRSVFASIPSVSRKRALPTATARPGRRLLRPGPPPLRRPSTAMRVRSRSRAAETMAAAIGCSLALSRLAASANKSPRQCLPR